MARQRPELHAGVGYRMTEHNRERLSLTSALGTSFWRPAKGRRYLAIAERCTSSESPA